ncbi:unnamed protein product [Ilex paraguariensis]|uniref:RING-type E3 ubiquitin transferase n=1 Tax=Ilex paraguariensis TaxID=185542 RepID=A0ABC8TZ63_9AQUA
MKPVHVRKLLQLIGDDSSRDSTLSVTSTTTYSPDLLLHPINASSTATKRTFKPNTPFDSSMALTILVLLTALFFMGFFSIYIRRFTGYENDGSTDVRRRRQPSPPSSSSLRPHHYPKGLDPATVKSLPLIHYGADANHPIEDCLICLGEFEEKEIVKLIPYCGHLFHPRCIDTWLRSHMSCPLCRSTKMFVKDDEEKCLGVVQITVDHGVSELTERSTVQEGDTWRDVGPVGVRRTCSCTSMGERVVLQRSSKYLARGIYEASEANSLVNNRGFGLVVGLC